MKLSDYNNHPRFSWTESSSPDDPNITYNVWRGSGFGPFQQIASDLTSTTYTDYEVYITQQGLRHFYRINANSGDGNIQSPGFSNTVIYRGWFGKELVGQINEIPNTFILLGNNPNPFNPYTNIQYGLPEDAEVTMNIFDLSGRNLHTFNNFYEAGYLNYKWNGRDNNGNPVSSGVYIYSILAISTDTHKNFIGSGKMILLK